MRLSVGVLLSIILKRKRKSRLTQLRQTLSKQQRQQIILYQYPAKYIFCILCMAIFTFSLEWFFIQFTKDMDAADQNSLNNLVSIDSGVLIQPSTQVSLHWLKQEQKQSKIENVRRVIYMIHLLTVVSMAALGVSMNWEVVKANKQHKSIIIMKYNNFGQRRSIQHYQVKSDDRLQIWQMGETKFTNTNYYYSIRLINRESSYPLIRKSNIYAARTAIIELGTLFELQHKTKIVKKGQECQED